MGVINVVSIISFQHKHTRHKITGWRDGIPRGIWGWKQQIGLQTINNKPGNDGQDRERNPKNMICFHNYFHHCSLSGFGQKWAHREFFGSFTNVALCGRLPRGVVASEQTQFGDRDHLTSNPKKECFKSCVLTTVYFSSHDRIAFMYSLDSLIGPQSLRSWRVHARCLCNNHQSGPVSSSPWQLDMRGPAGSHAWLPWNHVEAWQSREFLRGTPL